MQDQYEMEQNILWRIGKGDIRFWYDNRTNFGSLGSSLDDDVEHDNTRLCEVFTNGELDWSCLKIHPPESVKNMSLSTQFSLEQELEDSPVWTVN